MGGTAASPSERRVQGRGGCRGERVQGASYNTSYRCVYEAAGVNGKAAHACRVVYRDPHSQERVLVVTRVVGTGAQRGRGHSIVRALPRRRIRQPDALMHVAAVATAPVPVEPAQHRRSRADMLGQRWRQSRAGARAPGAHTRTRTEGAGYATCTGVGSACSAHRGGVSMRHAWGYAWGWGGVAQCSAVVWARTP